MADNQYRRITGPDGPIDFPSSMSDSDIEGAMRRLYPPKQAAPQQFPPEVNAALRSVPRPPDAIRQTRSMSLLDSLEDESMGTRPNQARSMVHGQVIQPKTVGRETTMPLVGDVFGLSGYPQAVGGAEQLAEGTKKDFYQGSARLGGGVMQAASPLMLGAGVGAPRLAATAFGGSIVGGYAGEKVSKAFGGSPEAQEFGNFLGSMVGGGAAGGFDVYRMKYRAMVDQAKSDLRAQRGYGASVDETLLQQAAEAKVQTDIAKANSFPELGQEGARLLIKAAQAGAFQRHDQEVAEHFGVDAKATTSSPQTGSAPRPITPTEDMLQQRGPLPFFSAPEAETPKTRPETPVERIKNLTSPPESAIMGVKGEDKQVFSNKDLRQSLPNKPVPKLGTKPQLPDWQALPDSGEPSKDLARIQKWQDDRARYLRALDNVDRDEAARKVARIQELDREFKQAGEAAKAPAKPVQPGQPVQAPATAKGPGEPVQPPKRPEVEVAAQVAERLGSRPPSLPSVEVFNQRVKELMKRSPNMAEGTARRMVADQIKKERGSLSFQPEGEGGPEDIKARREKKINDWVERLRNLDTPPEELDRIMKNLKAYGVEHDEIIRRVSGAEGFASPYSAENEPVDNEFKESLEERAGNREDFETGNRVDSWTDRILDKLGSQEVTDNLNKQYPVKEPERPVDWWKTLAGVSGNEPTMKLFYDLLQAAKRSDGIMWDRWQKADYNTKQDMYDKWHNATEPQREAARQRLASEEQKQREEIHQRHMDFPTTLDAEITARYEQSRQGESDITGVKSPDVQELERMWNLGDERGSLSFKKRRGAPPGGGTPVLKSSLNELTTKLEASMKAIAPDDHRMKFSEKLDRDLTKGWDELQISLGKISSQAIALKDMALRPPKMTGFRSALGRFSGSLNRSAFELQQFTKMIKKRIPDERSREAITNWIQAGGDDQVLADRAQRSKGSLRAGYEAARALTPQMKMDAQWIMTHFDQRLQEAIKLGILQDGLDNYVPQIWKQKDQAAANSFFSSLGRSGTLKPTFASARHRILDSYFEGEQKGFVPQNKDIGFLVGAWNKAMNQAIASRNFIRDMTDALASDGKPVVAPSGTGVAIKNEISTEGNEAYLIYPKAMPKEYENYRALDHAAMTKWKWATKDDFGNPIMVKGDLRVHPEHYNQLNNIINRGKWAGEHPITSGILKGQSFFKATLLSLSPFHQIQEGTHAIFHKVNPFNPPPIDLYHPTMTKLLDHGLVIGEYDPIASFEEGLNAKGGLVGMVPGIGGMMQKYSGWLFQDYIPRLKSKMAMEAYERNIKRYGNRIANGDITTDQVAELTASQANAAFGELNYMMLGRNPGTQAALRMMFLAPDFLEARARFVGQAMKPSYGKEQYAALFRGAMGMYAVSRVLNQLLDDDPHWDRPFSLVVHGYEYKMRSLPGDIWHLMTDPHSFVMHRLNPVAVKSMWELGSGKDDFGRRRTMGEQVMDAVRSVAPIPTQGLFKSGNRDVAGGMWSMLGVSRAKYRSKAAGLAHQYMVESIPPDVTSHHIMEMVRDIDDGSFDSNKVNDYVANGQMNAKDIMKAIKMSRLPEFYRDYRGLTMDKKMKVWDAATPEEKATLLHYGHKEIDVSKLLPQERQEYLDNLTK